MDKYTTNFKMKVYLAGKFANKRSLALKRNQIQALGHAITFDWISHECHDPTSSKQLGECARKDLRGVSNADVVMVVMDDPKYSYRGTFTEIGAAIALKKKLILVSPNNPDAYYYSNIFWHHPHIDRVDTWVQGKTKLVQYFPF